MQLAIDIGNTNIVIGCFKSKSLIHSIRIETRKGLAAKDWKAHFTQSFKQNFTIDNKKVTSICISSVVPKLNKKIEDVCQNLFQGVTPVFITHHSQLHLKIETDTPGLVGIDRLINAATAYHKYKQSLIVIDLGTAITFDCVLSPDARFTGGVIVPGPGVALQALADKAAQLSPVHIQKPKQVVGKNTNDCLVSGLYFGYSALLHGIVARIKNEVSHDLKVIVTGGLAPLFLQEQASDWIYEENLILEGLQLIAAWNQVPTTASSLSSVGK